MKKTKWISLCVGVSLLLSGAFSFGCRAAEGGSTGSSSSLETLKKEQVIVTFLPENGEEISTQTIEKNKTVSLPTPPTKKGYAFAGWTQNGASFDPSAPIMENITLTAAWTLVEYSISYQNLRGAVNPNPTAYTIESGELLLQPIQTEKYTFLGWDNGVIAAGSYGNKEITARWGVTVTFDTVGGVEIAPAILSEGVVVAKPADPEKPAKVNESYVIEYVFSHWEYDGKKFDFSTPITENITLTANYDRWIQKV